MVTKNEYEDENENGKKSDGWKKKIHISESCITQIFDFTINKNTSENLGNSA